MLTRTSGFAPGGTAPICAQAIGFARRAYWVQGCSQSWAGVLAWYCRMKSSKLPDWLASILACSASDISARAANACSCSGASGRERKFSACSRLCARPKAAKSRQ